MNPRADNQTESIASVTGAAGGMRPHRRRSLTSIATSSRVLTTAPSRWKKHWRWRVSTSPTA